MIEMLINPKKAERRPWEMFFVGLFYATISLLLVTIVFAKDTILREASGLLIVTFTVFCCLPFMYFLIKEEEGKDIEINDSGKLIKEHSKALQALMWMFLGFVVAFAFWYMVLPLNLGFMEIPGDSGQNFNFQIKTFCAINSPNNYAGCIESYGVSPITGAATASALVGIFANNIYVLIFTILFSLAFGAGAVFILVWNASVIAAAIGIYARDHSVISGLFCGLLRYIFFHGALEIAAYFLGALAGGIVSVAVIRKDLKGERMWKVLQDALILIIIAILVLIIAAIIEVYLTGDLMRLISSMGICN